MKKQHIAHALTLLSAALLVACGGGGGGGGASGPITLNGVALKGPLKDAIACADMNENGICDEDAAYKVRTNPDGTFTLSLTKSVPILVVTDNQTLDDRGNGLAEGTVLKAPAGSTVVSLGATMIAAGATNEQVAKALGYTGTSLPDFKTFNPFKGTTADDKAKQAEFEKASMQVYTAISAIASGASNAGASSAAAFDSAFTALADIAKDPSTTTAIDFLSPAAIDDIAVKARDKLKRDLGNTFVDSKFDGARAEIKNAVVVVNTAIKATPAADFDVANASTKSLFGVATKLVSEQIASRVKDDVPVTLARTDGADVLLELKKTVSATKPKVSDVAGFWEGTFANGNASALVLNDGNVWWVMNASSPRVLKASLSVTNGDLNGTGSGTGYTVGSDAIVPFSMSAIVESSKLIGSLTSGEKRDAYEFTKANTDVYDSAASYEKFANTWTIANQGGWSVTWTLDNKGKLTGSSVTTGCTYGGAVTLRSEGKAIVDAKVVETCNGQALEFNGIAYVKGGKPVFTLVSSKGPLLLKF